MKFRTERLFLKSLPNTHGKNLRAKPMALARQAVPTFTMTIGDPFKTALLLTTAQST
ncbi:hypothetical protein [Ectopseudomonas toyotomiensis]|uniref:hypothetical protein n=1 Tax=Ectopseudomonas toyotomiensis TaxID=554344 RepID=UPI003D1177DF